MGASLASQQGPCCCASPSEAAAAPLVDAKTTSDPGEIDTQSLPNSPGRGEKSESYIIKTDKTKVDSNSVVEDDANRPQGSKDSEPNKTEPNNDEDSLMEGSRNSEQAQSVQSTVDTVTPPRSLRSSLKQSSSDLSNKMSNSSNKEGGGQRINRSQTASIAQDEGSERSEGEKPRLMRQSTGYVKRPDRYLSKADIDEYNRACNEEGCPDESDG